MKKIGFLALFVVVLTACVTINVYFPEAKAREAAQRTVNEIMGTDSTSTAPDSTDSSRFDLQQWSHSALALVVNFIVPEAHAASPGEDAIKQALQLRYAEMESFYKAGVIGFSNDGLVAVRDLNAASPRDRAKVRSLVDADNNDRVALYKESARALGNPEWESRQQGIYAQEWIKQAKALGFWYQQPNGEWTK